MNRDNYGQFEQKVKNSIENLFNEAKKQNEFAYVFSLLGLNSGIEDQGWQPIAEALYKDIPKYIVEETRKFLTADLLEIVDLFERRSLRALGSDGTRF